MEAKLRWILLTAVAPVSWGTTYFVTHRFLPTGYPLYGAAIRALPAGLLLLLWCRRLPRGSWWWRALVLGTLNMGAFFALVYLAAQLLATSIASTVMATSPVAMMLLAWAVLAQRPAVPQLIGAGLGVGGTALMLWTGPVAVQPRGVLAAVTAMGLSSVGYILTKKWGTGLDVIALTAWQLLAGGLGVLVVAVPLEGTPPRLDRAALLSFGYVTVVATALAFVAWFTGLAKLGAGTVGLIGLLNPVTGVLLGTVLAGEALGGRQFVGLGLVLTGILLGQPALARRWSTNRPVRPRALVDPAGRAS